MGPSCRYRRSMIWQIREDRVWPPLNIYLPALLGSGLTKPQKDTELFDPGPIGLTANGLKKPRRTMPGLFPSNVTNLTAALSVDRCGVIRRLRGGCFVPIVAHRIIPTDIIVEFQEYPHGLAGFTTLSSSKTHAQCLGRSVFRTQVPSVRALLRKPGLGLKLQGRIRSAMVSTVLGFDQVQGCALLEQPSGFETHNACVRMSSEILDHDTLAVSPTQA